MSGLAEETPRSIADTLARHIGPRPSLGCIPALQADIAGCIDSARQRNRARHASRTMSALEGPASLERFGGGAPEAAVFPKYQEFGGDMSYDFRSLALEATALAAAAVISGAAFAQEPSQTSAMMNPADWAFPAGNYANWRHSTLKQIDTGNVGKLQVAWTLSSGVLRGHEGSPLVIGDTMYFVTPFPNNVYAVNLSNLTYRWKYEPTQNSDVVPVMCCDTVNRGLGYADGMIFLQQADTTLVALN